MRTAVDQCTYCGNSLPESKEEIDQIEQKAQELPGDRFVMDEILTLLYLFSGTILFLFGLILCFFSKEGTFTLQWNSLYWPLYWMFGVPLLYKGWKKLSNLKVRL